MSIMDNDWTKSREYQELLDQMMSVDDKGRVELLTRLEEDVGDAEGQEEGKEKVRILLTRLEDDMEKRRYGEYGSKYPPVAELVERLTGIDL